MINKFKLIFIFILISCVHLNAQEYLKHEFSVGAFGGIMSLNHKMPEGNVSDKISGGIGFGYTYFFNGNIGLSSGLDFAFYNQKLQIDELSENHAAFDLDIQKDFDFRYTLKNYEEEQNAFYLNIPIMLNYQFGKSRKVRFYGAGGFKIGLPVNGKYKTTSGELATSGYYPHTGDLIDDIPFRGFGNFDVRSFDDKVKYKMSFNLAIEGGAKWKIPNDLWLYTGLFVDYGLNDIKKTNEEDGKPLVQYNPLNPEDHIYNGIASSSNKDKNGNQTQLITKVNTMSYGLKIRLAFGK